MWLTENLLNFHIKEVLRAYRPHDNGRIGSLARSSNHDDVFICPYQSGICRFTGYFANNFHPAPEHPEGTGDDVADYMGIELFSHGAAQAGKEMRAGKDYPALTFNYCSIFSRESLHIWGTRTHPVTNSNNF
jgi:hypothetical protein